MGPVHPNPSLEFCYSGQLRTLSLMAQLEAYS
jgi:hypothetical protein